MKRSLMMGTGWMMSALLSAQIATIREDFTEYECTGDHTGVLRRKVVIDIKDKRGEKLAFWVTQGEDKVNELRKFEGIISDSKGKVTKVKKSDLGYTEYSEAMTEQSHHYVFSPRSASYPMTVEYQWEETFSSNIVYPMFAPLQHFDVALDSATYRIITGPQNTLRYKAFNFEPEVKQYDMKGKNVTEVTLSHLAPIKYYRDGLNLEQLSPHIYFAPEAFDYRGSHCDMTTWQNYGQWCYDLNVGRDKVPTPLLEKLKAMTDTCTSVKSKVGVVRDFMGQTTRYVNIVYGIGGYRTRSAEEVYKTGVGDCKALTNYFCSMLHALGIPAVYTLIGDKHLMQELPNMQQLNHVIAQVPLSGDTLWVECTNPKYPFDYCPSSHRGYDVLLITPEGGVLSRIPDRVDAENVEIETFEVTVYEPGDATVKLTKRGRGAAFEAMLPLFDLRLDEQKKAVTESLYLPHPTVNSLTFEHRGHENVMNMDANSIGWGRISGSRLFLPITPHVFANLESSKAQPHVVDLEDGGCVEIDTIHIHLSPNMEVESLPASQTVESTFGSFGVSVSMADNTLHIVTRLDIHSGRYPAEQYADWVKFRQQIAQLSKKQITVKLPNSMSK